MLLSLSLILILGMFMGWICRKMKLPALLGMLITGIILGPYGLKSAGWQYSWNICRTS